jgi:hypothetical protein
MSKEIKDAAQQQAEESFNQFMYWMKKGTIISCLFLAVVVVGCNAGVEDDTYPAYNGEQYNPSNMSIK